MKPLWLTAASETHREIYRKHFLDSFMSTGMDEQFDLECRSIEYVGGDFSTNAFNDMGRTEMRRVLDIMKRNPERVIVSTGCDIRFYKNVSEEILANVDNYDLISISDVYVPACGDFVACRVSDKIIKLYEWMLEHDQEHLHQQHTFNHGIRELGLSLGTLPNEFWTVGMQYKKEDGKLADEHVWQRGWPVNPPANIALHHANYCVGAADKLALLSAVQNKKTDTVKIGALMSCPRLGFNDTWGCIANVLTSRGIPIATYGGAWWEKGLQCLLVKAIEGGADFAVCFDYDGVFDAEQFDALVDCITQNPHIDALAALQCRREHGTAMLSFADQPNGGRITIPDASIPVKARTAHFGLTIIRLSALKDIPKPWFMNVPGEGGSWEQSAPGQIDADIYFWLEWEKAGRSLYVLPAVQIGHLENLVSLPDAETGKAKHFYLSDWRKRKNAVKTQGKDDVSGTN